MRLDQITLLDLLKSVGVENLLAGDAAARAARALPAERRPSATALVVKASDEKRFLLTVAYPAYKPDVAVAADGRIDVASADVVERACWGFARKGLRVGAWHKDGFDDAAEVVENYIWRGDAWAIKATDGSDQIIMPGDWLVGLICQKESWELYKAGYFGGVSPQGRASRQKPSEETLAAIRRRADG